MANPAPVHDRPARSESTTLSLDDLLRVLPSVVKPPPLASGAPEVCYVGSCQKEFVEPSLVLHSGAVDAAQAGRIYQLHPEKVGLDYSQVRGHVISPETARFLRDLANGGDRAAG